MTNENGMTTTTPVVGEDVATTVQEPVANGSVTQTANGGNQNPVNNEETGYVKIRVDRAKEQTTKSILNELGVANLDEAKQKIADGTKALDEVNKLKAQLEAQKYESEVRTKRQLLTKVLDTEKVFDADALLNYVDLDKVKLENGQIQDVDNIVASLKQAKPNFFGSKETVSDGYVRGQAQQPLTPLEKQKKGNVVGAIDDYLKVILK